MKEAQLSKKNQNREKEIFWIFFRPVSLLCSKMRTRMRYFKENAQNPLRTFSKDFAKASWHQMPDGVSTAFAARLPRNFFAPYSRRLKVTAFS